MLIPHLVDSFGRPHQLVARDEAGLSLKYGDGLEEVVKSLEEK